MSRMINKLEQNNSHKRVTIANVYASTPKNILVKRYSISLSGIDTASSSSGDRNLQLQIQGLAKKRKKLTKGKRSEDSKWRIKDSDSEREAKRKQLIDESLNENRKKNLKSKKKAVKRKQILQDTDSEWETESERSINELSTCSRGSILNDDECIKLFEDPCTPEKIRDIPNEYEEIFHKHESPIIGFFGKRSHLISKKNDVILQDISLPVNLQSPKVRNLEETDEDEILFHTALEYESNTETHVSLRKSEKSPKQKPENFSFPIQFPTTTNNLRRDQSVKTYPGKTSRHSALSSSPPPMKLMDFMRKLPNIPRKTESIPIPPGMTRVSGYWNKTLRKWQTYTENSSQNELKVSKRKIMTSKRNTRKCTRKQKYNVYDAFDETDEFETGGRDGKRMTFREFCQKKRLESYLSDT